MVERVLPCGMPSVMVDDDEDAACVCVAWVRLVK